MVWVTGWSVDIKIKKAIQDSVLTQVMFKPSFNKDLSLKQRVCVPSLSVLRKMLSLTTHIRLE